MIGRVLHPGAFSGRFPRETPHADSDALGALEADVGPAGGAPGRSLAGVIACVSYNIYWPGRAGSHDLEGREADRPRRLLRRSPDRALAQNPSHVPWPGDRTRAVLISSGLRRLAARRATTSLKPLAGFGALPAHQALRREPKSAGRTPARGWGPGTNTRSPGADPPLARTPCRARRPLAAR